FPARSAADDAQGLLRSATAQSHERLPPVAPGHGEVRRGRNLRACPLKMRDRRARQLFFAERSGSKLRLGRAYTTWTRSIYSRTHCQFRCFAGWGAPCKPWARNGWKTWAVTT